MRINIFIVLLIVIAIASVAFFAGKNKYQVVDANKKAVKGKFVSLDGVTATLKA